MTFHEAQIKFSRIVGSISPALSSGDIVQAQRELLALMDSLPSAEEFSPIASTIAEFSSKLVGQTSLAVLRDLQSRAAAF